MPGIGFGNSDRCRAVGRICREKSACARTLVPDWLDEGRSHPPPEKVPEVHLHLWPEATKGAETDHLTLWIRLVRGGA